MAEGNRGRAAVALRAAAVVVAGLCASAGQQPGPSQEPLPPYRRIVSAYGAGATSRAVADLLALTRADVERSIEPLAGLARERRREDVRSATGWSLEEIEAAARMHLETAGRLTAVPDDFEWHLFTAIRLLRLEAARVEEDTPDFVVPAGFRRDGMLVAAWQLQSLRSLDLLARCLTLLEADFPGDAEVLLAKGTAYEAQAHALLPSLAAVGLGGPLPAQAEAVGAVLLGPRRGLLREAESAFRRALALDDTMAETRLRLGRVVGLGGRHAEALAILGPLLEGTGDRWVAFLARMFAGASAEGLRRFDEAVGHFTRAVTIVPKSQSARVALSHALRMLGDVRGALAPALEVAAVTPDETDEPWWEYHFGQLRLVGDRLLRMAPPEAR